MSRRIDRIVPAIWISGPATRGSGVVTVQQGWGTALDQRSATGESASRDSLYLCRWYKEGGLYDLEWAVAREQESAAASTLFSRKNWREVKAVTEPGPLETHFMGVMHSQMRQFSGVAVEDWNQAMPAAPATPMSRHLQRLSAFFANDRATEDTVRARFSAFQVQEAETETPPVVELPQNCVGWQLVLPSLTPQAGWHQLSGVLVRLGHYSWSRDWRNPLGDSRHSTSLYALPTNCCSDHRDQLVAPYQHHCVGHTLVSIHLMDRVLISYDLEAHRVYLNTNNNAVMPGGTLNVLFAYKLLTQLIEVGYQCLRRKLVDSAAELGPATSQRTLPLSQYLETQGSGLSISTAQRTPYSYQEQRVREATQNLQIESERLAEMEKVEFKDYELLSVMANQHSLLAPIIEDYGIEIPAGARYYKTFYFVTRPISCKLGWVGFQVKKQDDDSVDNKGEFVPREVYFGRFKVCLRLNWNTDRRTYDFNDDNSVWIMRADEAVLGLGYCHPHVSAGGAPCFGSQKINGMAPQNYVKYLLRLGRVTETVAFLCGYLGSCNRDSPYMRPELWPMTEKQREMLLEKKAQGFTVIDGRTGRVWNDGVE